MSRTVAVVVLLVSTTGVWIGTTAAQGTAATLSARERCLALSHLTIPAASIGLPTNGATVVSATFVTATDTGNTNGEFCKVLGGIHAVDPTAPDIKFEVNLPTRWNNRMLQMGGGGFDGTLVTGLGGASNQIPTSPTPLAIGYVTLGSDSGHETAGGFDGRFGLNAESFANFGRLQIKKTHDVAKRREMIFDIQRYVSQQCYYAFGPSVGCVSAWKPYVKNYGPNIGHDVGGRLQVAWLEK